MPDIIINKTGNGTGKMKHAERVEFIDHSKEVLAQMNRNASAATMAAGIKAVNLILWQMRQGYGERSPIRITGDLQRDVSFEVVDDKTVNVGNTLEYAVYVHEGTRKMGERPYITDALNNRDNAEKIEKVYQKHLSEGFE